MEFPPLDPTDYIRLGMRKYKKDFTRTSKYHWKAAKDREFCLSVLDERRLAVIGLQEPWTKSYKMSDKQRWTDGTMGPDVDLHQGSGMGQEHPDAEEEGGRLRKYHYKRTMH